MHLIQLLLPLYDNAGRTLPKKNFMQVRAELIERFGGLTAHTRAPLQGLWQESEDRVVGDDLVIYEVITKDLDAAWWRQYRADLERRFEQKSLVVRSHEITVY